MTQKNLIIILVAVILIGGAVVAGLFAKPPTVTVSGAQVSSLNLSSIGLNITLDTENFYPIPLPTNSIRYTIAFQGKETKIPLGSGEKSGVVLQPGTQTLTIPVLISNPSLVRSAIETVKSGEVRLLISGEIVPDFFGIAPAVPFKREVTVPVPITQENIISTASNLAGKVLNKVL
jgi:LEA14-like dessication related protein